MPQTKVIALDFDGTCVQNEYPKIGKSIGAERILAHIHATYNVEFMLWTMRTGKELAEAQAWLADKGIPIWATNVNPSQARWSKSPKCYANIYVDDTALGMPLTYSGGKKDHVNWFSAGTILEDWCMENAGVRCV